MKFMSVDGFKCTYGKDKILKVKTDGWEVITFDEILHIVRHIFENEERIYPKSHGFMGSDMFFKKIKEEKDAIHKKDAEKSNR